jgi:hypothetical protein
MPTIYEYISHSGYYIIANIEGCVTFQVNKAGEEYIFRNKLHIKRDISKAELYKMYEKGYIYTTGVSNTNASEEYLSTRNRSINSIVDYSKIDLFVAPNSLGRKPKYIELKEIPSKHDKKSIRIDVASDEDIECSICGLIIQRKRIIKHINKFHNGVSIQYFSTKKHEGFSICEICGLQISTKRLGKHIKKAHNKADPLKVIKKDDQTIHEETVSREKTSIDKIPKFLNNDIERYRGI